MRFDMSVVLSATTGTVNASLAPRSAASFLAHWSAVASAEKTYNPPPLTQALIKTLLPDGRASSHW